MTLQATSGTLQPATSQPFGVFDKTCPANSILLCSGHDKSDTTFVDVQLPDFGTGFTQIAFTLPRSRSRCDGSALTSKGALVTIVPPPGYEWPNYITTTFRFSKEVAPGTGVANFTLLPEEADGHAVHEGPRLPEEPEGDLASVHLEAEPERRRRARPGAAAHVERSRAGLG